MANGDFISYFRVSTDRQGKSGLGLDAQREAVQVYLNGGNWRVIAEFTEVESGRDDNRPALAQALAAARVHRVPLVVANVSRLTRSLAFLSRLLEAGVDVRFCDMPKIEGPAGRFMLQQMAAVAELEAGMISDRTKKALAAAKARGVRLGGDRGGKATDAAREKAVMALRARTAARGADLAPIVAQLRSEGITSATGLAKALTERAIPTARGAAVWSTVQVQRLLATINA